MIPKRTRWIAALAFGVCLGSAGRADAAMWKNVVRGLEEFDFQFNAMYNTLGSGYDVNYVADYRGGRTFDFGFAQLQLENGMIIGQAGYTTRGVPRGKFTMSTSNGFATAPLDYSFDTGLGLLQTRWEGEVLIDIDAQVDQLGFYDIELYISNRGTKTVRDEAPVSTAFDVGPIVVSGNIFVDMGMMVANALNQAAGLDNPYASALSARPINEMTQTADELQARLEAGEVLTDAEMAALINNSILASALDTTPGANILTSLLLPEGWLDPDAESIVLGADFGTAVVPEPAALSLLLTALAFLGVRRRSR